MVKILTLLFSLLLTSTAYATECKLGTDKAFFSSIQKQKIAVYTLTNEDQVKFTTYFNSVQKQLISNTAKIYFGILDGGKIGIVVMQDGCIAEGTIAILPQEVVLIILGNAGIDINNLVKYDLGTSV